VGCGSGILSIAAKKLGASYVAGTDIDINAVNASKENAVQNGVEADFYLSNVLEDVQGRQELGNDYDVVVANILADVIIPLAGIAGEFMKPGALFISSGIIYLKAEEVKEALLANGFEIVEVTQMGDWFSYVARK
jgi:ribosomal protein L11 methyltransferase